MRPAAALWNSHLLRWSAAILVSFGASTASADIKEGQSFTDTDGATCTIVSTSGVGVDLLSRPHEV
jgi:hypothetical protein